MKAIEILNTTHAHCNLKPENLKFTTKLNNLEVLEHQEDEKFPFSIWVNDNEECVDLKLVNFKGAVPIASKCQKGTYGYLSPY